MTRLRPLGGALTMRALLASLSLCIAATSLSAQTQATKLSVSNRNGQSFVTFQEASSGKPDSYKIYRSQNAILKSSDLAKATLVGTVAKGSYYNSRAKQPYVLKDGGTALAKGTGFLVVTTPLTGTYFYAVTAVTGSSENTALTSGTSGNLSGAVLESVAAPKPVLQSTKDMGKDRLYVHFAPHIKTPLAIPLANRPGRAFSFRVHYDGALKGPRSVFLFLHPRNGDFLSWGRVLWTDANAVQIFADDENAPAIHSMWFGYHEKFTQGPPTTKVINYTEERLLWMLDFVMKDPKVQADKNRVYAYGASLGAIGAVGLGTRYPTIFAATGGLIPAFGLTHSDFSLKAEVASLFGAPSQNLPTNLGEKIYDVFDYKTQLTKRVKAGVAPMTFLFGRADTITGWADKVPFVRESQKQRMPISFYWDLRSHTTSGHWVPNEPKIFEELSKIRLNAPVAVLSKLSLDDDPGNGSRFSGDFVGSVNGYASYDPTTAQETASKVRVDVFLKSDTKRLDYAKKQLATADLTLRRLNLFSVTKGSLYKVTTRDVGKTHIQEERLAQPNGDGLLTCPKVEISRTPRSVEFVPFPKPVLPYIHSGGTSRVGGFLTYTILSAPNVPAFVTVGSRKITIATGFGIWRIADPIFVWTGLTSASGLTEVPLFVANDPSLRNISLLAQGMAWPKFTNLTTSLIRP